MEFNQEILNYMNEIVMVVNDRYEIQFCSTPMKNLTGKTSDRLMGKKCHLVIFNRLEPCPNCQLEMLKNGKMAVDIEHDTITHRGFRKLYSSKFQKLSDGMYAEIMDDITSTKKLIDKLTHHTKELKASNVILNLRRKETEKEHNYPESAKKRNREGT